MSASLEGGSKSVQPSVRPQRGQPESDNSSTGPTGDGRNGCDSPVSNASKSNHSPASNASKGNHNSKTSYAYIPPKQREAVDRSALQRATCSSAAASAPPASEAETDGQGIKSPASFPSGYGDDGSSIIDNLKDDDRRKMANSRKHLALCLFGCFTVLGCRAKIVRQMAYYPPEPPGYVIDDNQFLWTAYDRSTTSVGAPPPLTLKQIPCIEGPNSVVSCAFKYLTSSRGNQIASLLFQYRKCPLTATPVILFSHGNATDIGAMFGHFYNLCGRLRVSVIAYDYSGYGHSTGLASEKNTFSDIRAVYRYARDTLKIPHDLIIAYGQSLGSGPSCDIGSSKSTPIGGLVLHSGISSGLRLLFDDITRSPWYDIYKNVEKLPFTKCPVFVVHGVEDQQVPLRHGRLLFDAASRSPSTLCGCSGTCPPPCCSSRNTPHKYEDVEAEKPVMKWWVPNADHNDVEAKNPEEYYKRMETFINIVQQRYRLASP